jgi:hypothetical protein
MNQDARLIGEVVTLCELLKIAVQALKIADTTHTKNLCAVLDKQHAESKDFIEKLPFEYPEPTPEMQTLLVQLSARRRLAESEYLKYLCRSH